MKVEEAKEKLCPFIKNQIVTINNDGEVEVKDNGNIKCIVTDCMAWGWNKYGGCYSDRGYCKRLIQ